MHCPSCNEKVDPEYAKRTARAIVINTKAVAVANGVKTLDRYAILVLGLSAIGYFAGYPSSIVTAILAAGSPILLITRWFIGFGRFDGGDDEYRKAYRDMKRRLVAWLILAALLILVIFFYARS